MTRRTDTNRTTRGSKPAISGEPQANTPAPEPAAAIPAASPVADTITGGATDAVTTDAETILPEATTGPVVTEESALGDTPDDVTTTTEVVHPAPQVSPTTAIKETYAASPLPALEAEEETTVGAAIADIASAEGPRVKVICHTAGGRRRAGRRWPEGETILPYDALSKLELSQLDGDPRFTVGIVPYSPEV